MRTLLVLLTLWLTTLVNAQIVLEKAYNFDLICPTCTTKVRAFNTELKTFYYIVAEQSIYFYNQDHSLYKQIDTKNQSERFCEIYLPSDRLFDDGNSIEFVLLKESRGYYSFLLLDENGDSIASIGEKNCDGYQYYTKYNLIQYVKTVDGKSKLIVNGSENFCDSVFVYNVPGSLSQAQENLLRNQSYVIFPNPSRNYITLATDISILDKSIIISHLNGTVVKVVPVKTGEKEKTIDISNLIPGVYLYRIGKHTGKFIVE